MIEILTLELHSIIAVSKTEEVKSFSWTLTDNLIFCWGNAAFGIWGVDMIAALNPSYSKPFKPTDICISRDRSVVLLKSAKNVCLYYLDESRFGRGSKTYDEQYSRLSENPFTVAERETLDPNLRRLDISGNESLRRSQDIRTEDLIDEYDRRNTPEKGRLGLNPRESQAARGRGSREVGRNNHRFEDQY